MKIRHRWKVKVDCPIRFITWLAILCIWFKLTKRLNEKDQILWNSTTVLSGQGIIANKFTVMRNETTCFRLIWIQNTFSGSVHKYPELLFKRASQPAERVYSTESLEDTVFPVLLRTVWKAEVSVSDDVTLSSDLGRDKNVSLPTFVSFNLCFKDLQHVLSVKCLSLLLCGDLNPSRPTLDDSTEFRSHWVR